MIAGVQQEESLMTARPSIPIQGVAHFRPDCHELFDRSIMK